MSTPVSCSVVVCQQRCSLGTETKFQLIDKANRNELQLVLFQNSAQPSRHRWSVNGSVNSVHKLVTQHRRIRKNCTFKWKWLQFWFLFVLDTCRVPFIITAADRKLPRVNQSSIDQLSWSDASVLRLELVTIKWDTRTLYNSASNKSHKINRKIFPHFYQSSVWCVSCLISLPRFSTTRSGVYTNIRERLDGPGSHRRLRGARADPRHIHNDDNSTAIQDLRRPELYGDDEYSSRRRRGQNYASDTLKVNCFYAARLVQ